MAMSIRSALVVCLLALTASPPGMAAVGVVQPNAGAHATDRIIVQLSRPAEGRVREWARQRGFGNRRTGIDPTAALSHPFQNEARRWNASRMQPVYFEEFAHPELAARHGLDRFYIIEVPPGTNVSAMAQAFAALGKEVDTAGVDPVITVAGDFVPNDPFFTYQYGLRNTGQFVGACNLFQACHTSAQCGGSSCVASHTGTNDADIDASEAWLIETGLGADITLAIIDSGVSPHDEFGARLIAGRNTADPILNPTLTIDQCNPLGGGVGYGHGTHVAGIAAAGGHDSTGMAGVTWGAKIMPVRVLTNCSGHVSALTNGIIWAAENGAQVANFSLQYYFGSSGVNAGTVANLQAAIDYATDLGMILISATGNHIGTNSNNPGVAYPARLRNVLAVGGTDSRDRRAIGANVGWGSNFGIQIDVAAPGDDIYSTSNAESYFFQSGTSMASPHVSGVAALMKAYRPDLGPRDIADILTIAVDDKGPAGWDQEYGYGRVNALKALTIADSWPRIQTNPANRAIDARQPTDSLAFETYGWDSIEIMSAPDVVAGLTVESIAVEQRAYVCSISRAPCSETAQCPDGQTCVPLSNYAPPPVVVSVIPIDAERATVVLDRKISLQAWTRIQPDESSLIRLAFLPGDVNANQLTDSQDLYDLIAELPTEENPEYLTDLPEWSVDLDRSGAFAPMDVLTCIDLLNGADLHAKWLGKSLEPGIE